MTTNDIFMVSGITEMENTLTQKSEKKVGLGFKIFFFFKYMGQGILYPFLVLYLNNRGIRGAEMGLLLTLLPLGKVFIAPILSYLSDLNRVHKYMLIISLAFNTLGGFLLYRSGTVYAEILLAVSLIALGESVSDTFGVTLAMDFLAPAERQTDYGRWRLWGAVGFMIGAVFLGLFMLEANISIVPFMFALTQLCAMLASLNHPPALAKKPQDWLGGLKMLREVKGFMLLLAGCVFSGLTFNVIQSYYSVYMVELGAASWMVGMGVGLQVIVEIILSANTKRIIGRFSLRSAYLLGFLALPVRVALYILNKNAFVGLLIQNLHGLTVFGAFITGILVLDRILKNEWRSTGQSYHTSSFAGVGAMLASFFAPLIYDAKGITMVWVFAAVTGVIGYCLVRRATRTLLEKDAA